MASIRKRQQRNGTISWAVVWRDPETGKQTSHTLYSEGEAKTLKRLLDANQQRLQKVTEVLESVNDDSPTIQQMLDLHISNLTRPTEGTIAGYKAIIRDYLTPQIGSLKANKTTQTHLADWVKWMQSQNKAPKTIANAHGLLSAAFQTGIANSWITNNPCKYIRLPRNDRAHQVTTFLTIQEFEMIEKHLPEIYKPFARFLVSTGLRFGEATALTWSDIQQTKNGQYLVHVTKAWKQGESGYYLGTPKSRRSNRVVSLPSSTAKFLAPGKPEELIFTNRAGGRIQTGHFYNFGWKDAIDKAKAEGLTKTPRTHDLRHTHASWLLQEGIPLFAVSRRLGHESINTTANLYGHLMPEAQELAANAVDIIFQ